MYEYIIIYFFPLIVKKKITIDKNLFDVYKFFSFVCVGPSHMIQSINCSSMEVFHKFFLSCSLLSRAFFYSQEVLSDLIMIFKYFI